VSESRSPQKPIWGRLLLLMMPLVAAIAFSAWWVKRPGDTPAKPAASAAPVPSSLKDTLAGLRHRAERVASSRSFEEALRTLADPDVRTASIQPSFTLDLETGVTRNSSAADLWWHFQTRERRLLDTRNGAVLALIEGREWRKVDAGFLSGLRYQAVSFPAFGGNPPIRAGVMVAVRTAEGNYAKVLIDETGQGTADLKLRWVLYKGR
jgi:hypothetical protein